VPAFDFEEEVIGIVNRSQTVHKSEQLVRQRVDLAEGNHQSWVLISQLSQRGNSKVVTKKAVAARVPVEFQRATH
jgi:hypothetical protein